MIFAAISPFFIGCRTALSVFLRPGYGSGFVFVGYKVVTGLVICATAWFAFACQSVMAFRCFAELGNGLVLRARIAVLFIHLIP
jgi:hypothetical protein